MQDNQGMYRRYIEVVTASQTPYPVDIIIDPQGRIAYGAGEYDLTAMLRVLARHIGKPKP